MRRYILVGLAMIAMVSAVIASGAANTSAASPTVVSPGTLVAATAPDGWYFWNDKNDTPTGSPGELVSGPGTPPVGTGSVRLGPLTDTGTTAGGHSVIATNRYFGTGLASLTALSYSTYQPGPTLAISLQFDVRYRTTDSAYGGRLVFEPYQNGAVTVGSGWQSWSPLSGIWWATKTTAAGTGGAQVVALPAGNCAQSSPCTWAQINAAFPAAAIYGRFLLKAGSGTGWTGFDGNADNLTVGVSSVNTTFDFEPNCSTVCYVRPDGNDANTGLADTATDAKKTIQAAVNQVSASGTVHVAAGTYPEQVAISKNLVIDGAGVGSTFVKPSGVVANATRINGNPAATIFDVENAASVNIQNLTADGSVNGMGGCSPDFVGFYYKKASGSLSNVAASHIKLGLGLLGCQTGVGIFAEANAPDVANVVVNNATVNDYQKGGIVGNRTGTTLTVSNSTVTGIGSTPDIAQNGIQIGFGATGSIHDNIVSANACTSVSGGCTADPATSLTADGSAGILLYTPGAATITVQNNTLTGNQFGVWTVGATDLNLNHNVISGAGGTGIAVWDCDQWCGLGDAKGTTGTMTNNTISGQTYGLLIRDIDSVAPFPNMSADHNSITGSATDGASANVAFDAKNNWWGSASGPKHASNTFNVPLQGDPVTNNVAFVPWLNAAPPAGVSFAPVTDTSPVGSFASIQAGVNASNPAGTVNAAAGTFTENVVVGNQVTIAGAGQASTFVIPAVSNPNCGGGGGGSLCAGGSNIMLVQANNVTIHDIGLNGDNPALASGGPLIGGADIDARNGIITNHALGVYQNLTVHDVTVKNIFLRGMYASSGGTFNFNHDTVQNVQGNGSSIALFNFGGAGTFANNNVSDANDAIASNWSAGTTYANNVVTASGSGVHSDNNGGSGGVADSLTGNTVSNCMPNGYGVWVFAPFRSVTVSQNTVTNCAVGLTSAGQQAPVTVSFTDNEVDGQSLANSTGVYLTTSLFGYGDANSTVTMTGNTIKNNTDGFYVEANLGFTASLNAQRNSISGNTNSGVFPTAGAGTFSINMTPNWWGSDTGPAHALNPLGTGNSVPNGVIYSPWLGIGTDASPAAGFQLASPMTWIAGPAVCGATCIQAAIDDASNGDTVKAKTGVFPEHVVVNKSIILTAGSLPIVDGGGSGDGITITVPNATVSSFEVRNVTRGIVIAAGANNATVSSNNVHNFTSTAIRADNATGANISTNTINGGHVGSCTGGYWGIQVQDVSGTIGSNVVSGIGNGATTGCQEGRAIEADGTGTVQITNNNLSQYQKSGIIVRNAVNSTIAGNTTAGEGATSATAQNGITVTGTGTTSITGNHTSGHAYTPESNVSCGILVFNTATVTGNDSTQDEVGICAIGGNGTQVKNNSVTKHLQQGVLVDGAANIIVDNNIIDGQGNGTTSNPGTDPDTDTRYYGIFAVDSTGTLSNNIVKGIKHGLSNGLQSGVGIRLTARGGATPGVSDMTISGNNVSDTQKNAVVVTNAYGGTSVNAIVTGNTVAGNGPIAYIAQNGIQISGGATASVANNNVSGYDYTPSTWAAVGILLYGAGTTSVNNNVVHDLMEGFFAVDTNWISAGGNSFTNFRDTAIYAQNSSNGVYTVNTMLGKPGSTGMYFYSTSINNSMQGNAVRDNDNGVVVDYTGGAATGNTFAQNCIAGNTVAGMATVGTQVGGPVDATNNWWGKINGADPAGHGDKISPPATINAVPFLVAPVAGCPVPLDGDGDGLNDTVDNCPTAYNPDQTNTDHLNYAANRPGSDNLGDACDPDISGDGYGNVAKAALGKNLLLYCSIMRADVDGDGVVSILDLSRAAQKFGQTVPPAPERLSQDADNVISILDLARMAQDFSKHVTACP